MCNGFWGMGFSEDGGGEGEIGGLAEAVELLAEVGGDDGEPLLLAALEMTEEAKEAACLFRGEAAGALVPEEDEASAGGDLVDDGIEHRLSGGVGDIGEAVVEGEAALPAGEATRLDDAAAKLVAEGIAGGVLVGAHDELGLGVEGGDRIVMRTDGFAGAVKGDEGAEAGVLFEVGDGDAVDVLVGQARWVEAEVGADRSSVRLMSAGCLR